MSALQVYNNSTNLFTHLLYTSTIVTLLAGVYFIYKYINDYIENNNRKMNHSIEKIEQLSRLNHIIETKIRELDIQLTDLYNTQLNHSRSLTNISNRTNVNGDNILKINIEQIKIKQSIPDYSLIGYNANGYKHARWPIIVPNNFTFDTENIKIINGASIIIEYLKYFKNIREIKLDDFRQMSVTFESVNDSKFTISISDVMLDNRNIHNYIPNIQDASARNYYKNGLRKLRSLLFEMDIKLILNDDFEDFIR